MNYNPRLPSIADMEQLASKRVPRFAWDYLSGGIGKEYALARNRSELDDILLWPRYLTDVAKVSTGCNLFGHNYSLGIGISPIGLGSMIWPNAEIHLAKAAQAQNIPYILSTMATTPLEEIAKLSPDVAWFQLYVPRDESVMQDMIKRVRLAGFKVLIVTVDIPIGAKRDKELKNDVILPFRFTPKIIGQTLIRPVWLMKTLAQGIPHFVNLSPYGELKNVKHLGEFLTRFFMPGLTVERLAKIRTLWQGPLVVKGVQRQEDIEQCMTAGIDGVILSNHGGRQLDAAPSSIESLSRLPDDIKGKLCVMLDSGIRSGLDVVRARATGADAVFSGRSFFYAMAAAGNDGGRQAIEIYRDEITRTLQQLGCVEFEKMNGQWLSSGS